ncbi:MAG: hypothetical protein WD069_16875 [Planctomycetales bacterium]
MVRTARFAWNPEEEPDLSELRDDLQALQDAALDESPRKRRRTGKKQQPRGAIDGRKPRGNKSRDDKANPSSGRFPAPRKRHPPANRHLAGADWLAPRSPASHKRRRQ